MNKKVSASLGILLVIIVCVGIYGVYKPLPEYVGYESDVYMVNNADVELLVDRTYKGEDGEQKFEHQIFDTMLEHIETADSFILADMFLFNDQRGQASSVGRELSAEFANALVEKSTASPDTAITLITDPINSAYGSYLPTPLSVVHASEINFITTDLTTLRDSNPLYSALWRTALRFVPNIGGNWLPNPFDPNHEKATLSAYLSAFNFKANHRKLLLTDYQVDGVRSWRTLITSMNPHDGSSRHSNVGVVVRNAFAADVLKTEEAIVEFSGGQMPTLPSFQVVSDESGGEVGVQLLTERKIKDRILQNINQLEEGDELLMAVFYFSDRDIVKAIKKADERGASIRILLDPNKNAFGREKNGIPNRQVSHELMEHTSGNTTVRWCSTLEEQCHSKIVMTKIGEDYELILGSANLTRRNLDNLNLETNVRIIGTIETSAIEDGVTFFEDQWGNEGGLEYSLSYKTYADSSLLKTLQYRFGEYTGISHY
ncbi:MAG: phospholipase D-like domain-containing protein [Candidatus Paceibacteria bacterium]